MSRTEKTTRMHYLPWRVQSRDRDAMSGSYPTKFRTVADNRFGNNKFFWDDTKALNYGITQVILPSVGLPSGSVFNSQNDLDINQIGVSSSITRGIGDYFHLQERQGVVYKPFTECDLLAVDGAVSNGSNVRNRFYTIGSEIEDAGYGFQQPLSAKTMITIDMTLAGLDHPFGHRSGSDDQPMTYYNHETKTYNRIGSLNGFNSYPQDLNSAYFRDKAIGFGPCADYVYNNENYMGGAPIDSYGFPNDSKYMPTTANTGCFYTLTGTLTGPFMLEKVVVEFSASLNNYNYASAYTGSYDSFGNYYLAATGAYSTTPDVGPAYTTFFILNARQGVPVDTTFNKLGSDKFVGPIATSLFNISPVTFTNIDAGLAHTSGTLELVTYMQFGTKSCPDSAIESIRTRELMFGSEATIYNGFTTGFAVMSGTVKAPSKSANWSSYLLPRAWVSNYYYLANRNGNRNGLPEPVGRNWQQMLGTEELTTNTDAVTSTIYPKINTKPSKNIPYILLPTDKLIVGWQAPSIQRFDTENWYNKDGPRVTLKAGEYKLKLYGSYLKMNEFGELVEAHDTVNQLLSSNAIHEVIE